MTIFVDDPVTGRNRHTGERVRGRVVAIQRSDLDGQQYAEVADQAGAISVVALSDLVGPRRCYRPTARDPWDGTCARCGRNIYPNGPYDTDRLTHRLDRVASRYR